MSARMWSMDARTTGRGLVYLDFSFLTNNTSSPATDYATSGSDTMGSLRGEGVTSITRTGVGTFLLTLTDGYRGVVTKYCDMEANGGGDGAYATIGAPSNEGLGNSKAITLVINTHAAAGTLTDFTGRRVSVNICLKDSMEGR